MEETIGYLWGTRMLLFIAILFGLVGGMGIKSRLAKVRLEKMGYGDKWLAPPQFIVKYKWEYGGKIILIVAALIFAPPAMIAYALKALTFEGIELHLLVGVVAGFMSDVLFSRLMSWYAKLNHDIRIENGNGGNNGRH